MKISLIRFVDDSKEERSTAPKGFLAAMWQAFHRYAFVRRISYLDGVNKRCFWESFPRAESSARARVRELGVYVLHVSLYRRVTSIDRSESEFAIEMILMIMVKIRNVSLQIGNTVRSAATHKYRSSFRLLCADHRTSWIIGVLPVKLFRDCRRTSIAQGYSVMLQFPKSHGGSKLWGPVSSLPRERPFT